MSSTGAKRPPNRVDLRAEPADSSEVVTTVASKGAEPQESDPPPVGRPNPEVISLRAELAMARVEIASLEQQIREPAANEALRAASDGRAKAESELAQANKAIQTLRKDLEAAQQALAQAKVAHERELGDRDAQLEQVRADIEALRAGRGAAPRKTEAAKPELEPTVPASTAPTSGAEAAEEGDEKVPKEPKAPLEGRPRPAVDITALLEANRSPKSRLGGVSPGLVKGLLVVLLALLGYAVRGDVMKVVTDIRETPHVYATKAAIGNLAGVVHTETGGSRAMDADEFERLLDGLAGSKKSESLAKDGWGVRFRLDELPYEIRSAGPDMQFDTDDDVIVPLNAAGGS